VCARTPSQPQARPAAPAAAAAPWWRRQPRTHATGKERRSCLTTDKMTWRRCSLNRERMRGLHARVRHPGALYRRAAAQQRSEQASGALGVQVSRQRSSVVQRAARGRLSRIRGVRSAAMRGRAACLASARREARAAREVGCSARRCVTVDESAARRETQAGRCAAMCGRKRCVD